MLALITAVLLNTGKPISPLMSVNQFNILSTSLIIVNNFFENILEFSFIITLHLYLGPYGKFN